MQRRERFPMRFSRRFVLGEDTGVTLKTGPDVLGLSSSIRAKS